MRLDIPLERLTVRASRSGGPGGQNVNKVSSRIEVRFVLDQADWIPASVRARVRELFPARITTSGELRIVSSRFREQHRNLRDCLDRLSDLLEAASTRPRRRVATAPTAASRRRRIEEKRRRSLRKRDRGGGREEG